METRGRSRSIRSGGQVTVSGKTDLIKPVRLRRPTRPDDISRWIRSPSDEKALELGYVPDERGPQQVAAWMKRNLRHTIGEWAGNPFELLDWQFIDVIEPLFGWRHRETNRMRFHMLSLWMAKKNGKTTLGAALGLLYLCGLAEQASKVYSAAVDRDQASLAHGEAIRMVERSEALARELQIVHTTREIRHPQTQSTYQVISQKAASKHGLHINCAVLDEIHAWPSYELWEALIYGTRARKNPMLIEISTAGVYDPESIGFQHYTAACKVRDGLVENVRMLPVIYEPAAEDPWDSPATWMKANPSLGVTIEVEHLVNDCEQARGNGRAEMNFKRYTCNQWVTAEDVWIRPEHWTPCAGDVDAMTMTDVVWFGGLDLSSVEDVTAFVLAGLAEDERRVLIWPVFWIPKDTAQARQTSQVAPYFDWGNHGHLRMTPGELIDHDQVRDDILELLEQLEIVEVAYDPWNCAQLATQLQNEVGLPMVKFNQSCRSYNEPCRWLELLVRTGRIEHNGNPVLDWMVNNAVLIENHTGHVMPKKRAEAFKIDGVAGMLMALARLMFSQPATVELISDVGHDQRPE